MYGNSYKLARYPFVYHFNFTDPVDVGGFLPELVTVVTQSGDLMGFITGFDVDGFCSSLPPNSKLMTKYADEQILPGL